MCAECANGNEAVARARELKSDIASWTLVCQPLNGFDATGQILGYNPEVNVLILTVNDSAEVVRTALNAGSSRLSSEVPGSVGPGCGCGADAAWQNIFFSSCRQLVLAGYLGNTHGM